jgi:uncharacterized phage protein gp47/JayE
LAFSRPTIATIAARVKTDVQGELETDAAFYDDSFERATVGSMAGVSHQLHGHLAWIARQLDPRTADDDIVESVHGEPFGVFKKDAVAAKLTFEAPGTNGTTVTAGTVWVRSDGARYTVDDTVVVSGGVAELDLTAEVADAASNCADETVLELLTPIAGMDGDGEVAGTTTTGTDRETPADYLVRVLARKQTPPRGGASGDYIDWTLEVAGVTRAWEYPALEGLGTVTIYAVNDAADPITLSGGKITEIEDYIDEPGRKPVTHAVYVFTPTLQTIDMTINLSPNTADVRTAVQAEIVAMLAREASPGNTDGTGTTVKLSKLNEAISIAADEDDHAIVSPVADVAVPFGSLAVIGTITWGSL